MARVKIPGAGETTRIPSSPYFDGNTRKVKTARNRARRDAGRSNKPNAESRIGRPGEKGQARSAQGGNRAKEPVAWVRELRRPAGRPV